MKRAQRKKSWSLEILYRGFPGRLVMESDIERLTKTRFTTRKLCEFVTQNMGDIYRAICFSGRYYGQSTTDVIDEQILSEGGCVTQDLIILSYIDPWGLVKSGRDDIVKAVGHAVINILAGLAIEDLHEEEGNDSNETSQNIG